MASTSTEPTTATPTRRPYKGSCHCGLTQYIIYITLPPPPLHFSITPPPKGSQRVYKCNCSTCQKTGFFHVRPAESPDSFLVLGPLEDEGVKGDDVGRAGAGGGEESMGKGAVGLKMGSGGLLDYTCFDKQIHWYFCSICGVRCFDFTGKSELITTTLEGKEVRAWKPKKEGWKENQTGYLSINACTLEQDQEGLDLREWHEKRWIGYLDCKEEVGEDRFGEPYPGGIY